MRRTTPPLTTVAALAVLAAIVAAARADAADAPAMNLVGKGVQIYSCQPAGTAYAWKLKAPDAILLDDKGETVGRHFAGPTWQARDGSTIVGEPLVASPSPQAGSVAWLVLRVKSTSGAGVFATVAYVVRSATRGGTAPSDGCDASHAGLEVRAPYSATYTFFPKPDGAP